MGNCDFRGYNQSTSDDKKEVVLHNDNNTGNATFNAKSGVSRDYIESLGNKDSRRNSEVRRTSFEGNIAVKNNESNKDLYVENNNNNNENVGTYDVTVGGVHNENDNYGNNHNYEESRGVIVNNDNYNNNDYNNNNNNYGNNNNYYVEDNNNNNDVYNQNNNYVDNNRDVKENYGSNKNNQYINYDNNDNNDYNNNNNYNNNVNYDHDRNDDEDDFNLEVNHNDHNNFVAKKKTETYEVQHGYKKYVDKFGKGGFGSLINNQIIANQ